jgi:hypothetical protein
MTNTNEERACWICYVGVVTYESKRARQGVVLVGWPLPFRRTTRQGLVGAWLDTRTWSFSWGVSHLLISPDIPLEQATD